MSTIDTHQQENNQEELPNTDNQEALNEKLLNAEGLNEELSNWTTKTLR